MKITKKTSYIVYFSVFCYEETEGGMDVNQYGLTQDTLEEALELLEIANTSTQREWFIKCLVEKTVETVK